MTLRLVHTCEISIGINVSMHKHSVNRCDISTSISTRKWKHFLFLILFKGEITIIDALPYSS